MSSMLQRSIMTYNPVFNGAGAGAGVGFGPCDAGLGNWTSVITAGIQATVAVGTLAYQQKMAADAAKREEHRVERERAAQLELIRAQQAAAQAQAEQMAAQATGGAVALDAHGQPINASGVMSAGPAGALGLSRNTLVIGGVAVGLGAIVLIGLMGRRRR